KLASWQTQGLQRSQWHPSQPIDVLIENVRRYGAHLVVGKIGQKFYEHKPFPSATKIAGQTVYAWITPQRSAAYLAPDMHAVVLVGADQTRKCVYYIDPLDGSDPKKEAYPKIYAASYEELQKTIANLF